MRAPKTPLPAHIEQANFQWTRSEALALAQQSCTYCFGLGLRPGRAGRSNPCNCVFRAIFRACYERFRVAVDREKRVSHSSFEPGRRSGAGVWSMKEEEFAADFCLVTRRVLATNEHQHRIFRFHYLLGADWTVCCAKLGVDRGTFFHDVYRIEQKLGRAFRELQPYPLFPIDEYFFCNVHKTPQALGIVAPQADEPTTAAPPKLRFPLNLRYKCA